MSDSDADDPGVVRKTLRTVSPAPVGRPNAEMDTIGWGIFLGVVILLVPLLPFLVIALVVSKVIEFVRRQTA